MKLSFVIPAWNESSGPNQLLEQVAGFGLFHEVIVVDDASGEVLEPETVPSAQAQALAGRITWLCSVVLKHICGSHVIFFDSDDLFTAAF